MREGLGSSVIDVSVMKYSLFVINCTSIFPNFDGSVTRWRGSIAVLLKGSEISVGGGPRFNLDCATVYERKSATLKHCSRS